MHIIAKDGNPPHRRFSSSGRRMIFTAAFTLILAVSSSAGAIGSGRLLVIKGVPFALTPTIDEIGRINAASDSVAISLDGDTVFFGPAASFIDNGTRLTLNETGEHSLEIRAGGLLLSREIRSIDGVLVILPPLIAIVFALVFKQVIVALLAGVWLGSMIINGYNPLTSSLRIVDHYIIDILSGSGEGADHITIIVFTLLLGGMVGITSKMGGMQGIVDRISKLATNPRRGQLTVWLMGVIIFFDDYTNTLIVGNSTRPLTDKLRISREKLSYIVDSTAAPITSLAVITSWIGFQISLINQSFVTLGIDRNPLGTFVSSLPYSTYPILAVLFVLFVILSGRDYSSMYTAELRARSTGKLFSDSAVLVSDMDSDKIAPAEGVRPLLINGIIPIAVVISVAFAGLMITGRSSLAAAGERYFGVLEMLKESDSFKALLWGSSSGCLAAALLALGGRKLTLTGTMAAWVDGVKSMIAAIIILILAWCIGRVCTELHTADYLVHHLSGMISPHFLPMLVFLLAMGISFSTGTSWGTMSILTPIVIPLAYGTSASAGIEASGMEKILLASIAAILSGAVFGDHCSPISDTTIMSSMASGADHIDHVRTQLPYALTVGVVSLVFGYALTGAGLPVALSLVLGTLTLLAILRIFGRRTDRPTA